MAALSLYAQLLSAAAAMPQTTGPREELHGVLSRQQLKPPLRDADVSLHYSPDGRYLMAQDSTGIYVFSREPLRLRMLIGAEDVYPARFSSDSQEITAIGHSLTLDREKLPAGPKMEQNTLPFRDGCLDAELSPGAEFVACLTPDFTLIVYPLSSSQQAFSESIDRPTARFPVVFVPLGADTAFSSPFGFRLSNKWDLLVNRGLKFLPLYFSSDGKNLFVVDGLNGFRVDLTTRQKTPLPGPLRKRAFTTFSALDDDRVLLTGGEKEEAPAILSLKSGNVVAVPSFKADAARLASNPRYALLSQAGIVGDRVFDLDQNRELETPVNLAVDIFENEIAVVNDKGELFLYRIGETLPFRSSELPLDPLPVLRAAAVTPNLDRIAFALNGSGGIFSLDTGQRLYSGSSFASVNFSDSPSTYLLAPRNQKWPPRVLQLDLSSGESTPDWSSGKDVLRSGGTALLEYGFESPMGHGIAMIQENGLPYCLRALEPATGKELWKREFPQDPPVPFADPQGERLVLAWNAKSPGAESAAKSMRAVWDIFKHAKLTKLDSFFEVLDARSGKSVCGVLVQQGSGPYSYDAAFSVGDVLFLTKDGKRVSVYSLQDGDLKARLVGGIPTANAQNKLFALEEGPGRLCIYDLATATRLDQQLFPDAIAYTHFSADGNRLFVLSKHQVAYILDVSGVRTAPTRDSESQ